MTVLAGWREVFNRVNHGRAEVYHIVTDHEMAACRPDPTLDGHGITLNMIQPAADVPPHMRCQRNGCRQRWP